jgi:Tfp pilus assembly protein PilF
MARRRPVPALVVVAALLAAACAAPLKPQGVGDSPAHHYTVGMKLLETGEAARAQEEFERARGLDPDYAPAYEGLGWVALARKDAAAAERLFKQAKAKSAKYVPAYLGLARAYMAANELGRARDEAESAVKLEPRNARAHLVLGQVFLAQYEFARAEASFSKSLELEPGSAEARREWDRSVKIRQAAPGTLVGKRIALADPVTRGELAALLATELGVETQLRKRRPELFDPSFRPPGAPAPGPAGPVAPTDIASHWARNAIELVMRLNLMDAYPDGKFRPDEPVTRAGLATTLEQVLSVITNDPALKTRHLGQQSPFPDVRSDHFAFNAAVVVTTRGLMEAERPSGAFRLLNPVSGPEALLAMRKLAEVF